VRRKIITYAGHFERFVAMLSKEEVKKLKCILSLLETTDRMPVKFIKYLREGLYELRMEYAGNAYRVFFVFDYDKIVVLFNGFQKKTQKMPAGEVEKALKIKEEYYGTRNESRRR
jgi:phage-related protein